MIGCNDYMNENIFVEIIVLLECDYIDIKLEFFMFCRNYVIYFIFFMNWWFIIFFDKRIGRIL